MENVELLILDLDGTLLDNSKVIRECDRVAVRRAVESGVTVTVFTGRSFQSALPYVTEIGVDVPVVFQNGALIYDFSKKGVLKMTLLDGRVARTLVERSRVFGVFAVLFRSFFSKKDMLAEKDYSGPYEFYFEHNSWRMVKVKDLVESIPDFVTEVALVGVEEGILKVLEGIEGVSVVKSTGYGGEYFYEILGPGCSKKNALDFLEDHFDVNPDDVMFIGDGYNDLEIIESVGIGVAMGNAPEEVKEKAVWITGTNEECGVARAVERFVLNSRNRSNAHTLYMPDALGGDLDHVEPDL